MLIYAALPSPAAAKHRLVYDAKKKDQLARFMDAYRESIDYMYGSDPKVIKDYAEFAGVAEPVPGPTTEFFGALAKQHGVHLVPGLVERDGVLVLASVVAAVIGAFLSAGFVYAIFVAIKSWFF